MTSTQITATTDTAAAVAAATAPKNRRIGRRLAASLLVVVLGVAGLGMGAQPASAATQVTACFRWSSGGAYAYQPVHLMRFNGSGWVVERNGKTGANGCGTFYNTPSNVHLTVKAYKVYGDNNIGLAIYSGWAPNYTNTGGGGAYVGTGTVSLVKCTWGLYRYCANH